MEINNNTPPNPPQNGAQLKAAAHTWQVGQLLKAVVVETRQNSVKLSIGNRLLQAPTTKQHQNGETLQLTVIRSGEKPLLRVLPPLPTTTTQPLQDIALKTVLPKQAPLTPLLANLALISQLKTESISKLPLEISDNIKKLLDNIVHVGQLSDPKALRRAIANSGILLENRLANMVASNGGKGATQTGAAFTQAGTNVPTPTITQDFKGNLLQLLDILRQYIPAKSSTSTTPLPLQLPATSGTPGVINNPGQVQNPAQSPSQTLKENLLRLLNAPPNTPPFEKAQLSTSLSQLSQLTASLSRLPLPFFRQMPLLAQKAQLPTLALLQHRNQIIGELIRQAEGSVARIQLSQLASLPQDNNPQLSWTFELPLRHGETVDVVQLRIEKEDRQGKGEDGEEFRWKVTLTLDLPEIGTIYVTITISGESASTAFWAENPDTVRLIDNNLQLFRNSLEKNGVNIDDIRCQHGTPPQPPNQRRHTLLIDTQV